MARRHGLTPQQLFTWRRQARKETEALEDAGAPPLFVPAIMQGPAPATQGKRKRRTVGQGIDLTPTIELEVDGVTVRVRRDAQAKTIAAVIRALKAAR